MSQGSLTGESNAKRFRSLYDQLDRAMRERLNRPRGVAHWSLLKEMAAIDPVFLRHQSEFESFARLRNAIVHNPDADAWEPIADPHPGAVERYAHLISHVLNPPAITTIAIPRASVFSVRWDDRLVDTLTTMASRSYGLAPVLDNGRVIGLFSELTLVRATVFERRLAIDPADQIESLRAHILFTEANEQDVAFAAPTASVEAVQEVFNQRFLQNKRLLAVLVTDQGRRNGDLLGLVTAHDLTNVRGI